MKRRRIEIESHELLFAQLTSWVANTGFRTGERQTTAIDFMPSMWAKKAKGAKAKPAARTRMSKKKRIAIWQSLRDNLAPIARKG